MLQRNTKTAYFRSEIANTSNVHNLEIQFFCSQAINHDFCKRIMAKFTPAYLKKLEELLEQSGYDVRYEKGNFKSNFCILEDKKVVVINKFSVLESRIQSLLEIIQTLVASNTIQVDLRTIGLKNTIQPAELNFDTEFPAIQIETTETEEIVSEVSIENTPNN